MALASATLDEALNPESRYYRPRGRLREAWVSRDREVMTDGPAGTGKSRMWLDRLYHIAEKYPGSRHLICRKTRESLTESGLVTFEQKVLPPFTSWAMNQTRRVRQAYILPNKSTIVVGGLDKPEKTFSTEYDTIYVQEATELLEDDWESLLRSLRNGKMPYQQIVGDCNPNGPLHWIKTRESAGRLRLIQSRHEDNPELWDEAADDWTEKGREYIATLDNMTGVRHKRLRLGLWVGAENMVYEDYDPAVHVIDPFEIPAEWPRYRAVDFGFTNPFSCLWGAEDEDGRLFIYREVYGTQRLVRDWAHLIHELTGDERISWTVTDHDLDGRDDLDMHLGHIAAGCRMAGQSGAFGFTVPAVKAVAPGIERVAQRLRRAKDGSPRLFVFRNALVARDQLLVDAKQPCGLVDEFPRYQWAKARSQMHGEITLEEPLKRHDHSLDALRYLVMGLDGMDNVMGQSLGQGMKYTGGRAAVARPSRGRR